MTEETNKEISWDDATTSDDYVQFKENEEKIIAITNWIFVKEEKFGKMAIELQADCILEDKKEVKKQFTTTSKRFKKKLRPILEGKENTEIITISVIRVGDKYDTQYAVKEIQKE